MSLAACHMQWLAHNAADAQLWAKFKGLLCEKSNCMLRRWFDASILPAVSYGVGISRFPILTPDIKQNLIPDGLLPAALPPQEEITPPFMSGSYGWEAMVALMVGSG